jgi:hypothetical protein
LHRLRKFVPWFIFTNNFQKSREVFQLFKEWKAKNIPRTEWTYTCLVEALQFERDVATLDSLLPAMKRDNVRPTDTFYGALIRAYDACGCKDKVSYFWVVANW